MRSRSVRKGSSGSTDVAAAVASRTTNDTSTGTASQGAQDATYTVRKGDSLSRIANSLVGSSDRWPELFAANPQMENADRLSVGMVLTVPSTWIAKAPEPETPALDAAEDLSTEAPASGEETAEGSGLGSMWDSATEMASDAWGSATETAGGLWDRWFGDDKEAPAADVASQGSQQGADVETAPVVQAETAVEKAPEVQQGDVAVKTAPKTENQAQEPAADVVTIQRGKLTAMGEGSDAQTKYVHWPHTAASGVTLGKGYDIGSRSASQVIEELVAAGMDEVQATKISAGAGLKGDAAGTWVTNNKASVGIIAQKVQDVLLGQMLVEYTGRAKNTATNTTADSSNRNAAGRERKEGADAGTYVMSEIEWSNLHPAMVEFLTDLIYQGGYYGWDRVAKINEKLKANDGDQLAQFKAVRELFTQDEGEDSYMDRYASGIGEGRENGNASVTFGDATVNYQGHFRRNAIRTAYLDHVIAALEAGKDVQVSTGVGEEAEGDGTTTTPSAPTTGGNDGSLSTPTPTAETVHTVERGESLGRLAARFGVTIQALKDANADKLRRWGNVEGFEAGARITIPGSGTSAPTTDAPTTEAPASEAPATEAPAVDAPTVEAPTTEGPTTDGPATEGKGTTVPTAIGGSVGADGDNLAKDVRVVQQALIDLGWLRDGTEVANARSAADDVVVESLDSTIVAIKRYQEFGLGVGADGRIDVGGNTWNNLVARLQMIKDVEDHEIEASDITPVLSDSDWISQFPSDANKNGAGRGLYESEKAYAGKNNNVCCWDAAYAMTKKGAGQVSHLTSSRLPTLFQGGGEDQVLGKQAELGVKYIDMQLQAGKPVMIGVDDGRVEKYNADATTEHFIVIVGKVAADGKIYYRYFDPGTRWGTKGYSSSNLLEVGEDMRSMSGASYSGTKTYQLAQVRQNA